VLAGTLLASGQVSLPPALAVHGLGDATVLRVLGGVMLALGAAYLLACRATHGRIFHARGHHFRFPSLRLAMLQIALSVANWSLMGAVVATFLPQAGFCRRADRLAAGFGGDRAGPHSLGHRVVLEAVFIAMLGHVVPAPRLIAALLAYRACYYLVPLAFSTLGFAVMELRGRRAILGSPPRTAEATAGVHVAVRCVRIGSSRRTSKPMDAKAPESDPRPVEGEWVRRVREFDWSATPLGPLAAWPQTMRSALAVHETEIDHLRRLQDLSTRLVRDDQDEDGLLQDVMAAAIAIVGADSGELRLVRDDGSLHLIATQGLESDFHRFIDATDVTTAAAEAARGARRVLVESVRGSELFGPGAHEALGRAGVGALQASPLLARDGRVLGVLSTHHRDAVPGERDLLLLDLLARQAADWIERAHAAGRLEHSERRLQTILNQTVAGVMVLDGDGRMTYVNPWWCRTLGYREEELIGRYVACIVDPACVEIAPKALRQLEAGAPSLTLEKRYVGKGGHTLWGSSSINALRGPDGRYEGCVAVVVDIGEHKRLEDSLRDQAGRLQLALSTGRLGTWHINLQTLQVQASDQCKANFGLRPDEPMDFRRVFERLLHPEDRAAMRRALADTNAAHADYDAEFRVVMARRQRALDRLARPRHARRAGARGGDDGRELRRHRTPPRHRTPATERSAAATHDRRRPARARAARRRWPDPAAQPQLGGTHRYSLEDAPILQAWLRRAYDVRDGDFAERIAQLFETEHAMLQTDVEIVTRGGQPRTWSLSASSPGKLRDGRRFVVAMALDITERKRAEALLASFCVRARRIAWC
jgi:PAS domain S-box-containing protein